MCSDFPDFCSERCCVEQGRHERQAALVPPGRFGGGSVCHTRLLRDSARNRTPSGVEQGTLVISGDC
jgi:hypothetical protein